MLRHITGIASPMHLPSTPDVPSMYFSWTLPLQNVVTSLTGGVSVSGSRGTRDSAIQAILKFPSVLAEAGRHTHYY